MGGEQWGELLDGPVDDGPWTASRWKRGQTGPVRHRSETRRVVGGARITGCGADSDCAKMGDVCHVGPQDRRIRGSIGVFDAYHGWDEQAQFPALWAQSQKVHQGLVAEPNARLFPQPGRDHGPIWSQAGTLQVTRDVRYNSQRVMAVRTMIRTLGASQWFSLTLEGDDSLVKSRQETALAIWCNSTFGMLMHANHASRSQYGRGRGNKGMLETLPTLDVRQLQPWQLDEAQAIYRDFQDRTFESFHRCAVDPARIELDQRVVSGLLALSDEALDGVARLRRLLSTDPSVHGGKRPELPS